ncbi:THO complex subunit 5-like protein A [Frankliniella fusca]|uniref:THO complex subunit 5-like protein A n=1 Tax=Frankliniella fusca TaxID=407009 RepID=A0AAE1H776_9NEOP|nr:THO complex subunit 5-like protein A [Frankliniella fusca]
MMYYLSFPAPCNDDKPSPKRSRLSPLEPDQEDEEFEDDDIVFRLPTASEAKLAAFEDLVPLKSKSKDEINYILIETSVLKKFASLVPCTACSQTEVTVEFQERKGFCHLLKFQCSACGEIISREYSSPRIKRQTSTRPPFEVNRLMAESFISYGVGHAAMETFSETMGMGCMPVTAFHQHLQALSRDLEQFRKEFMNESRRLVREAYDWQKRGHTSNYGVGYVADIKTGLIVDYVSLSKYCHTCVLAEKSYGTDSAEFLKWHEEHISSGTCNKNFEGSSNAMEMAAALILWKRSEAESKMRYTTMISDGDAKTHAHLTENDPYNGIPITKEECINHVSKRLSTALKKLVSDYRAKGVTLGGSGVGQLTENAIQKLASYYRKALESDRENEANMKKNVMATIYHCSSTDKKPNHSFCPKGSDSWCFYNKAHALKVKPKPHKEMSLIINDTVFKAILPVYERLTDDELLKRCRSGRTQNVNESIHSVLWRKCPKEVFVSKRRLDVAMLYAAAHFNMGRLASLHLRKSTFGEVASGASVALAKKADTKRLSNSAASLQTSTYDRRMRAKKKREEERKNLAKEGQTYAAGEF